MMQPKQPKISQKLMLRSAIAIIILAGLVFAFQWYKNRESDPYGGMSLSTASWLGAIETVGDGKHAVVFTDKDQIVRQPDIQADSEDRDPVWRPDGSYLFFCSNREYKKNESEGKFLIYRWFPDGKRSAEMRSQPGATQLDATFLASDAELHDDATGLTVMGGKVMSYDPKKPALYQVLPPPDPKQQQQVNTEGQGPVSPFEAFYERLGTSFKSARYTPDRKGIFAVMRRETGEILVYQKLGAQSTKDLSDKQFMPQGIVAADRIDFDVDPKTGSIFFTVQNFQWPDPEAAPPSFKKNGKLTVPYRHGVAVLDPNGGGLGVLAQSNDDKICFGSPAIAPTGDKLVFTTGEYEGSGNMKPTSVVLAGITGSLKGQVGKLLDGEVYEPAWSPDGTKLAFAKRDSATSRPIYVWEFGSQAPRRVSPAEGVFGSPVFSPQTPRS